MRSRAESRETDLPGPAIAAGALALALGAGVWIYAVRLWTQPQAVTHNQRYLLYVLSALADLGLVPAAVAVGLGITGLVRRHVSGRWRGKLVAGIALGALAIGLTAFRYWLAGRGALG